MNVLFKSNSDYIVIPSNDPFIQKQQKMLIAMGYKLITDWQPPAEDEKD